MSATATTALPETTEEPTGGGKRKLLLLVLVLAVAAAAAWFLVLAPAPEDAAGEEPEEGEIVTLEALTTTTGQAALHHARVAMSLVLVEGADPAIATERAPLLQDALLRQVARMSADELRSPDGSDALRAQLTAVAQEIWPDGEVRRVVLTELLVQ